MKEALDPDELRNACDAYQRAIAVLKASHVPIECDQVAERIVTIARAGITDPDRLCRIALTGLSIRKS